MKIIDFFLNLLNPFKYPFRILANIFFIIIGSIITTFEKFDDWSDAPYTYRVTNFRTYATSRHKYHRAKSVRSQIVKFRSGEKGEREERRMDNARRSLPTA